MAFLSSRYATANLSALFAKFMCILLVKFLIAILFAGFRECWWILNLHLPMRLPAPRPVLPIYELMHCAPTAHEHTNFFSSKIFKSSQSYTNAVNSGARGQPVREKLQFHWSCCRRSGGHGHHAGITSFRLFACSFCYCYWSFWFRDQHDVPPT